MSYRGGRKRIRVIEFEGRCEMKPDILRSSGKEKVGRERKGRESRHEQVSNENRNGAC